MSILLFSWLCFLIAGIPYLYIGKIFTMRFLKDMVKGDDEGKVICTIFWLPMLIFYLVVSPAIFLDWFIKKLWGWTNDFPFLFILSSCLD